MHLGTEIKYLLLQCSRLLQATEIQLLHSQYEEERTQILTKLMLALEHTYTQRDIYTEQTNPCSWKLMAA